MPKLSLQLSLEEAAVLLAAIMEPSAGTIEQAPILRKMGDRLRREMAHARADVVSAAAPLSVQCPVCVAQPGDSCTTPGTVWAREPHLRRRVLAATAEEAPRA